MFASSRIPLRQLAQLCRRVGTSLEVGVDVRKVWEQETARSDARVARSVAAVRDQVCAGDSLANSIERADEAFPPLVRKLVAVGDLTGHTDRIFLRLADHYDQLLKLRRTLVLAILWPCLSLALALAAIGVVILVTGLVNDATGQSLDILGLGLTGSRGFLLYLLFLASVGAGVYAVASALRSGRLPPEPFLAMGMKIPGLRAYLEPASLARFSWALSLGLDAGLPTQEAIHLALDATLNGHYASHASAIDQMVGVGTELSQAFSSTGAFPTEYIAMLHVGEETGRLPESLNHISEQYQAQATSRSIALTLFLSLAIWGSVCVVILLAIFRIFSFYVGVLNDAGHI